MSELSDPKNSSSSYEIEVGGDSSSDDEAIPPEELHENSDLQEIEQEDELKTLEAELAELEKEEQLIRAEEEKLEAIKNTGEVNPHRPLSTNESNADFVGLLSEQLKKMINNIEYSDFTLISEGKKISCHRVLLASRCPYFKKHFDINRAARELNLKDVKYPVLMGLLEYIYTGKAALHKDWAEQLYFVAQAYEMPELQNLCEIILNDGGSSRHGSGTFIPSIITRSNSQDFSIPQIETDKMRDMRKNVATELLNSEKSYVKSLQIIFDEFVTPLNNSEKMGVAIVPKEIKVGTFSYWEVLLKCHLSLLKTIEDRVKQWDQKPEIGDIFIEKTAFIKLYKHYVNNFDKSLVDYKQLRDSNPRFKDFLSKLEYTPKLQMQSLQSFLIMPIQRIPRYVLMLQDLHRNTIENHIDYENLKYAVKTMKELADYINANKNDADEINKILAIQDKFVNWPINTSLVKPRRRIVKEGTLFKPGTSNKVVVVLFTDSLLYCKPKGKEKLKYKGLILLPTSSLNTTPKVGDFEIISQSGKVQFSVPVEEKDSWIKTIQDTMERSQSELLNSAFSGFEMKDSEGSKQFMKLREEENMRRRSEVALQIKESENQYVKNLKVVIESFMEPLKATLNNHPILPQSDITEIFHNLDLIYASHTNFLILLESKINSWNADSILGDLFLPQIINSAKLYQQYHEHHANSVERFEQCVENSINFKTFVAQKESESKHSLSELLDSPLKRLPKYYLLLEELIQYTPVGHQDLTQLKIACARLKEQVEEQQKLVKSITRKISIRNIGLARKGSFGQMNPTMRKSIQLSPVSRKSVDLIQVKQLNQFGNLSKSLQ